MERCHASASILFGKQRDRRRRFVGSLQTACKGQPGKRKRAAYLDWAQEDRDSEGIHLVLLELVTGQSVISAVSAPRQRVSLCVPIIAPYSMPASKYLHYEIYRIYMRSAVSRRDRSPYLMPATLPAVKYNVGYNELTWSSSPVLWQKYKKGEIISPSSRKRLRLTIDHLVWLFREKGRYFSEEPADTFAIYRGIY